MDGIIGFICGVFVGVLLGFFLSALMIANGREESDESGVDEVLDNLMQTARNQPPPYHDEERQEEFKRKYPPEQGEQHLWYD